MSVKKPAEHPLWPKQLSEEIASDSLLLKTTKIRAQRPVQKRTAQLQREYDAQ
jgi:hypothetical protein